MRFKQVRDIVDWAIAYHRGLAAQYRRLAREQKDQRVMMALDYLADHEHKMESALRRHLQSGDDALLNTWLDQPGKMPHTDVLVTFPSCLRCGTVEDVTSTAIAVHRTLEELYRARADTAATDHEREFFSALAQGQLSETRRMVRDMMRLQDY